MVDSAAMVAAAPQIQVWSTDESRQGGGVAYWRESIRIATSGLFDISPDVELKPFAARATLSRSGAFSFMAAESTAPLPVVRSRRAIDNAPFDSFSIYLQLAGRAGDRQRKNADIAVACYGSPHNGGAIAFSTEAY